MAWAQSNLKGVVMDANSQTPLVGASVTTAENKGTATLENGEFTVACSDRITVSFIGYETAQV
ncbi:MAG TPA: hypothetical protein DIU20_05610, partial [Cryomorphaceae bacterium]|nr:hypothetical protein [Cryomorphaceae bacterium]